MWRSRAASIRLRVAAVSGTCSDTTSASARRSSRSCRTTPSLRPARIVVAEGGIERDRAHAERASPERRSRHRCCRNRRSPASCRRARGRSERRLRGHAPRADLLGRRPAGRAGAAARSHTYSATARAFAPVAGITAMPRAAQAASVDVVETHAESSRPPAARAPAEAARPSTCVRLRTISASAPARASRSESGASTSDGSYSTSWRRASAATRALRP